MQDKNALPLQNVQNAQGRYELYWQDKSGNLIRVDEAGISKHPFSVVALYADLSAVAVQKNGNARNDNDFRLFLINLKNGSLVVGDKLGLAQIGHHKKTKMLCCIPFVSYGKVAQTYVWVVSAVAPAYMALNVPVWFKSDVSVIRARNSLPAVANIKSQTKTQCAKVIKVKPGARRGRPKKIANKNAGVPTKKQEKRVQMRKISLTPIGPVYDVYLNGTRVMTQCTGARAKTFMDNRVLAVAFMPQAASKENYNIFMPDGSVWTSGLRQRYSGMPVVVNGVAEKNGELQLLLSNKSVKVIRTSDLARFAPMQFVLDEKQR